MSLQDQFSRSGNWLFRHRSYVPLLALVLLLPALADFKYPAGGRDFGWELLCFGVGLLGFAIRVHVAGHVPAGTSGRNTRGQIALELNTTGLYSIVRHPLYVGNFLMWLGLLMFPRSWSLAVIVTLAFWLYYERIMFAEEEWCRAQHGDQFADWAGRTPAVLPRFSLWKRPALPFSMKSALRREYSSIFAFVAMFAALKVATDWVATGHFVLDWLWTAVFGATLALYLLLRSLKRHTHVLDAPGR